MPDNPQRISDEDEEQSEADKSHGTEMGEVSIERVMQGFAHFALSHTPEEEPHVQLEGEQVDRFLELADKSDERSHKRDMSRMTLSVSALAALLIFILLLSWLFLSYQKSEVLVPLVMAIGGLITGFIGGYGWAKKEVVASEEE